MQRAIESASGSGESAARSPQNKSAAAARFDVSALVGLIGTNDDGRQRFI
jgi:hypothetical protein